MDEQGFGVTFPEWRKRVDRYIRERSPARVGHAFAHWSIEVDRGNTRFGLTGMNVTSYLDFSLKLPETRFTTLWILLKRS